MSTKPNQTPIKPKSSKSKPTRRNQPEWKWTKLKQVQLNESNGNRFELNQVQTTWVKLNLTHPNHRTQQEFEKKWTEANLIQASTFCSLHGTLEQAPSGLRTASHVRNTVLNSQAKRAPTFLTDVPHAHSQSLQENRNTVQFCLLGYNGV
jgi:hypothetical protein